MKRRGRPCKDGSRYEQFNLRLSKDEAEKLEFLSYSMDIPKADVVRKALDMQYRLKKMVN